MVIFPFLSFSKEETSKKALNYAKIEATQFIVLWFNEYTDFRKKSMNEMKLATS